jgi:hypothetical protein
MSNFPAGATPSSFGGPVAATKPQVNLLESLAGQIEGLRHRIGNISSEVCTHADRIIGPSPAPNVPAQPPNPEGPGMLQMINGRLRSLSEEIDNLQNQTERFRLL